jgi:hypothetical protein
LTFYFLLHLFGPVGACDWANALAERFNRRVAARKVDGE